MNLPVSENLERSQKLIAQTLDLLRLSEIQVNRARDNCGWELLAEGRNVPPPEIVPLRVRLTERGGYWIAWCREYHVVAQCWGTRDDVMSKFCHTLARRLGIPLAELNLLWPRHMN